MKKLLVLVAVLVVAACGMSHAETWGDQWILGFDSLQNMYDSTGTTTILPGAGYGGTDAVGHVGSAGDIGRIFWELNGNNDLRVENGLYYGTEGPAVLNTPELYMIEFWDPGVGGNDWQPIESMYHGTWEDFPMEDDIPWAGQHGTNHQWIGSEAGAATAGQWVSTGPGPQCPDSPDYYASGSSNDSLYMWLTQGSRVYAKWDFPWPISRSWSVLRLTQVTVDGVIPEPSSLIALGSGLLGLAGVVMRRRRR